jgi:hypothetical protein
MNKDFFLGIGTEEDCFSRGSAQKRIYFQVMATEENLLPGIGAECGTNRIHGEHDSLGISVEEGMDFQITTEEDIYR